MKVIIAGTSTFDDYDLLEKKCDNILKNIQVTEIVSGGQVSVKKKSGYKYGADYFGEQYAIRNGYPIKKFLADWETHGKPAGPIRNSEMANYADAAIIFWNGFSKGSKDMIKKAEDKKLLLRVIMFTNKTMSTTP